MDVITKKHLEDSYLADNPDTDRDKLLEDPVHWVMINPNVKEEELYELTV